MIKLKCNVAEYGVIINQREEFLILKLKANKKFPKEAWMLPGGRLDENDQPEFGLQREVLEETSLKIKVIVPIYTARWGTEKPQKYVVFYLCKTIGKEDIKICHEHIEYKWIKFNEIDKINWHNQNSKTAIKKSKVIIEKGF